MTIQNRTIPVLGALLSRRAPPPAAGGTTPRAAVALVVRPGAAGPEVLLIRRADRAGDPWSGHVALPGGREQPEDADARATAVRETLEEVGLDLDAEGTWLGALPLVAPRAERAPRVEVRPFVFSVAGEARTRPNHEVAEVAWIPAEELMDPAAAAEFTYRPAEGGAIPFPARSARGFVVWGLTLRILDDFLELYAEAARALRRG